MTQQGDGLGRCAYAAYGKAVGGRTHDGRPLPSWVDLGETIQSGWRAAAQAATDMFVDIVDRDTDDYAYYPTDLADEALGYGGDQ